MEEVRAQFGEDTNVSLEEAVGVVLATAWNLPCPRSRPLSLIRSYLSGLLSLSLGLLVAQIPDESRICRLIDRRLCNRFDELVLPQEVHRKEGTVLTIPSNADFRHSPAATPALAIPPKFCKNNGLSLPRRTFPEQEG